MAEQTDSPAYSWQGRFSRCIAVDRSQSGLGDSLWDVIYTNSQSDTRIVSEKWCLQQGIKVEDCIYDDYTCWSPGGLPRYSLERGKLGIASWIDSGEESFRVLSLGRKYAVANRTRCPQSEECLKGGKDALCLRGLSGWFCR